MFSYQVYSEEQAMQERYQLLKKGEYEGYVKESIDKMSSSGNPMMDMTITVYDESGRSYDIRDFLVFTKPMMWKIVHFAKSSGLLQEYMKGKLCSDLVKNKRVRVKINLEEGREIPLDKLKDKPQGSKYPDKNKIEDHLVNNSVIVTHENKNEIIEDEDIPF